ncbi:MAG: DUF819 family protein [Bacteroidota bacterium]
MNEPLITNDAVIFGILMLILGLVFYTSSLDHPLWKKFYSWIPALLLCYFLPSVIKAVGLIDPSQSRLYFIASRYLLPASLVLLTISVDLKEVMKLGSKAVIMFVTGTVGIMIGGPLTIIIFSAIAPDLVGGAPPNEVWRGMTTIAGSWIGGSANQATMKEVFEVSDGLFSKMVTVDIIVGNTWLGVLIAGVGVTKLIDKKLKADASAIEHLKQKMEEYQASVSRIPNLTDLMKMLMIGFACTGFAHFCSDLIVPYLKQFPELEQYSLTSGFFWIVVIATALGVGFSFTKLRKLEGVGASRIGRAFVYILVATIGMNMDILAIFSNPGYFFLGITWILFHILLLAIVAKLIRAPYFFIAVGSTANVGGAASAPVIATEFHPSLAPVGVLMAVLGYVLGTYGAYLCGLMMQWVS